MSLEALSTISKRKLGLVADSNHRFPAGLTLHWSPYHIASDGMSLAGDQFHILGNVSSRRLTDLLAKYEGLNRVLGRDSRCTSTCVDIASRRAIGNASV